MCEEDGGSDVKRFPDEVAARFGVMPNFFCSASAAPAPIEALWAFARSAYLDSPLPSLFKERLFVHLSRFCEVRYCIVRHVGFLIGEGRPAGDPDVEPATIEQVVALLRRPLPDVAALGEALSRLEAHLEPAEIPEGGTQAEADLFAALTVVFLEPRRSERARAAVRRSLGDARFEVLTAYLAFIRTAHYWTETHPELAYEPDVIALMERHGDLARMLLDPSEAARGRAGDQLWRALDELHRTQGTLRASEEMRRVALESGRMGAWLWNVRERTVGGDPAFLALFGLPPSDRPLPIETFTRRISPAAAAQTEAVMAADLSSDQEFDGELSPMSGATAGRWIKWRGRASLADPALINGVSFDVTEQKRAEQALREREAQLSTALEAARMATFDWSSLDRRVSMSATAPGVFGYPPGVVFASGEEGFDRVHPEDRERHQATFERAAALGEDFHSEYRIIRPCDGQLAWLEERGTAVRDAMTGAMRLQGVIWDVTDRKRIEEALRASEEQYRTLFESIDEGFGEMEIIFDEAMKPVDYRFLKINPAWARHTGVDYHMGKTMLEIVPELEDFWAEIYGRVALTREAVRFQRESPHMNRWFDVYAFPVGEENPSHVGIIFTDITARKQTNEALRESEERFRNLVQGWAQAVWETDPNGVVVTDSPSWRAYTGQSVEEYMGNGWIDAVHPEDRDYAWSRWQEAIAAPGLVNIEFRLRNAAGGWRWTNVRAAPLLEVDGSVRKWFGMNIDISARCEAEQALRESEERLRQFGEASSDILWIRNARTMQLEYISQAFEPVYGVPLDPALHGDELKQWARLVVPEDHHGVFQAIKRVRAGERVTHEFRIRRSPDGQVRWIRSTDFPLLGPTGEVQRIGGIGQDVTGLKQASSALAESEERLRSLIEGVPQLVWRAVGQGNWTWASPQWVAYTGLSIEESRGHGWLSALHPDDQATALTAWRDAEESGLVQMDCRVRHAGSGQYHWFQTHGTPLRGERGEIAEWLGTSTDIDDQVRAREVLARSGEELEALVVARTAELQEALCTLHTEVLEREQAEERLRQSEKLKAIGQLTGGIAHDFNNMLQGIVSALSMLRSRVAQGRSADLSGYIDRAEKASKRAAALTHRLLAFGRQQTLTPKAISLDRIARDMEDLVRRTVGPAVQVELQLCEGQWLVLCDPNQMESALLNLCVNARDAMPEGGWLTISTEDLLLSEADIASHEDAKPGPYTAIAVSDTGTGMSPEVTARIFEPFFTTKPLGQGTGLGLSQIYGFVRQSSGIVQVETTLGKGTTVRLCLPVQAHNPDSEATSAPDNGKTVLLVEDEQDVRELVAEQLREHGYRVLEAESGPGALRLIQAGARIDLLVSDYGLPGGMNGRQVVEAVRERYPGLPAFLITGYAAGEAMPVGLEVMRKPFDPAALVERVGAKLEATSPGLG